MTDNWFGRVDNEVSRKLTYAQHQELRPGQLIALSVVVEIVAILGALYGFRHVDKWVPTRQFSAPEMQASNHSLPLSDSRVLFATHAWQLFDVPEGRLINSGRSRGKPIAASHNGEHMVLSGSEYNRKSALRYTLELYNAESFEKVLTFKSEDERSRDEIVAAAFSSNDDKVVTVTSKGKLQQWDVALGAEEWSAELTIGSARSLEPSQNGHPISDRGLVAFSRDAHFLATSETLGWHDNHIRVWQTSDAKPLPSIDVGGELHSIAFASDNRLLATASILTGETVERRTVTVTETGSRGSPGRSHLYSRPHYKTYHKFKTHLLAWDVDRADRTPIRSPPGATHMMITGVSPNGSLVATSRVG